MQALKRLSETAHKELHAATTSAAVNALRVKYLGKKGEITQALGSLGQLPPQKRRSVAEELNAVKMELEALLLKTMERVEALEFKTELASAKIDVTLPARGRRPGHRHPISQTLENAVEIFARLGFVIEKGPEIELDWYNFTALNVLAEHPARDMQDTFYVDTGTLQVDGSIVLRTHTSPVQIHAMLRQRPPVRAIMPGRVYRRDSDQTHTPMFHQIEGLFVDRRVTFAELKGTLDAFVRAFFGRNTSTRFRPSFFPFTEPSAEVDVSCVFCNAVGCRVCKQTGWLEILGCGMVHPNVFQNVGYDLERVSGFAFGMGVERLTMLRLGVDDLRTLFENDYRFVSQF